MLISFLYTFQVTMCPSSGETTVFMRHLVLVILCGGLSGIQGGIPPCHPYRITSTKCRTNTVVSPDDGHIGFVYKSPQYSAHNLITVQTALF